VPITHTQVTGEDTMLELGAKVLGNTASAILQARDQLNREAIDRAIDLLTAADRVEFYAAGQYGVVADDAQFKFLRFGVPSAAYSNPRLQMLAANVLRPSDVAVIISNSGRVDDLLAVAQRARERGAAVVAITASQSPLAKNADVALIVDHDEDVAKHVPMVSRILHLLVIDILSVGVAMRRGNEVGDVGSRVLARDAKGSPTEGTVAGSSDSAGDGRSTPAPAAQAVARRVGMGISSASPLASLTSHSR
jgi:glucokinase